MMVILPGIEAELYYVRDGVINNYALNFVVPVPSKIDSLHFTWKSLTTKPVCYSTSFQVTFDLFVFQFCSYRIRSQ